MAAKVDPGVNPMRILLFYRLLLLRVVGGFLFLTSSRPSGLGNRVCRHPRIHNHIMTIRSLVWNLFVGSVILSFVASLSTQDATNFLDEHIHSVLWRSFIVIGIIAVVILLYSYFVQDKRKKRKQGKKLRKKTHVCGCNGTRPLPKSTGRAPLLVPESNSAEAPPLPTRYCNSTTLSPSRASNDPMRPPLQDSTGVVPASLQNSTGIESAPLRDSNEIVPVPPQNSNGGTPPPPQNFDRTVLAPIQDYNGVVAQPLRDSNCIPSLPSAVEGSNAIGTQPRLMHPKSTTPTTPDEVLETEGLHAHGTSTIVMEPKAESEHLNGDDRNVETTALVPNEWTQRLPPQEDTSRGRNRDPELDIVLQDMFECYKRLQEYCDRDFPTSQDFVSITIPDNEQCENEPVKVEATLKSNVTLPTGSKVVYKWFEVGPCSTNEQFDRLRLQVMEAMQEAREINEDITFQLGSFAVLKYTDHGPKWWRLQDHWMPAISHIQRYPWNFLDLLTGRSARWTVKGFNLQNAQLKLSTVDEKEVLNILHADQMEGGEDVLLCEETSDLVPFRKEIYICALLSIEIEKGVIVNLQSNPRQANKAYWVSVVQGLIPSQWATMIIGSLSLSEVSHKVLGVHYLRRLLFSDTLVFQLYGRVTPKLSFNAVICGSDLRRSSQFWGKALYNFLVYMFCYIVLVFVLTFWRLTRGQVQRADNDESSRDNHPWLPLKYEVGATMTKHNAAITSSNWKRPSMANSVQNSSSGEDESGSSSSSNISSDSTGASRESNEVEGGSSVTWTADPTQTVPSTTKSLVQEEDAFDNDQAQAQPVHRRGSEAQRDQCHLSTKFSGSSSSASTDFVGNDQCPPHGSVSVCGRRRYMEDAVASVPSFLSLPCDTTQYNGTVPGFSYFHFFGVYDGHGGSQAAVHCADRLHHMLAEEMTAVMENSSPVPAPDSWDVKWKKAMLTCFLRMDAEVGGVCWRAGQCGKPEGSAKCCTDPIAPETVGSTAVVAVVSSCQLIIANCGDSRAVLSRGGHAIALSQDHKPDREDERTRVEAAGGRVIFWNGYRVLGVLPISRAIGDWYLKPFVIAEPEVTCTQRTEEDECLILASDGLWDVLSNDVVCDIARKCLAGHRRNKASGKVNESLSNEEVEASPAAVAAALLTQLALDRGSSDNISVVVVDLMTVPKR